MCMKKNGAIFILMILLAVPVSAQDNGPLNLEVKVEGIEGALLQNVLLSLEIEKRKNNPLLTAYMINKLHSSAPGEISRALEPLGYYQPVIEADLESKGQHFTAVYRVEPGEPVRVNRITITVEGPGEGQPETAKALERFRLKVGDILVHRIYEEGNRLILNAIREVGYLDAQLGTREVVVDPVLNTAQVLLKLETGPRYRFGHVTLEQDFLSEEYLRGFITIEEGEPYTLAALLELERDLNDTRQFNGINIQAPREEARDFEIPVTVKLVKGPSKRFTAGVGYGTDTGPRGSIGWEHRRVNRKGHRASIELLGSAIKQEYTARYTVPLKHPQTDRLDYSLGWTNETVEDIDRSTYLAGTSLTWARGKVEKTLYLNYERENFKAGAERGETNLLIPGVVWTLVVADDRVRTTTGYKGILELKGSSQDLLLSDITFAQAHLYLKGILSVSNSLRFLARTEIGTTWVDEFTELPPSQRYFAGGDQSVRGYGYKSIGPVDSTGEVVGGKYVLVASMETELSLSRNWGVAAFVDSGSSFNEIPEELETGAGMGIRWHTIIGSLRFDYAKAVSREGKPWRIHLILGPDL